MLLHLALIVYEFYAKNDMIIMDHLSYSPHLAPCDFLVSQRENDYKHFGDVKSIKRETSRLLKGLTSENIQHYFLQWKKRTKCIQSGGEYFEGNYILVLE